MHDPEREQYSMLPGDHLQLCKFTQDQGSEAHFALVCKYAEWLISQTPKAIGQNPRLCTTESNVCRN